MVTPGTISRSPVHELQQPKAVDELQTVQVGTGRAPVRILSQSVRPRT